MTVLYPNLCYNKVCHEGTALLVTSESLDDNHALRDWISSHRMRSSLLQHGGSPKFGLYPLFHRDHLLIAETGQRLSPIPTRAA